MSINTNAIVFMFMTTRSVPEILRTFVRNLPQLLVSGEWGILGWIEDVPRTCFSLLF